MCIRDRLNLVALILWTGGSFLMRLQVWPSVKFWFDISILGLLLLGFALFNFAFQFVGSKNAKLNLSLIHISFRMCGRS